MVWCLLMLEVVVGKMLIGLLVIDVDVYVVDSGDLVCWVVGWIVMFDNVNMVMIDNMVDVDGKGMEVCIGVLEL